MLVDNFDLTEFNTFGIAASAERYGVFDGPDSLTSLLNEAGDGPLLILGGGSNILLTGDIGGTVLRNAVMGKEVVHEDIHHVYVRAGAGESWHAFVRYCLDRNLAGVENLSLIPGSVGAAPMQNIGAYGVELKDVFYSLDAYRISDNSIHTFSALDCCFGYRESVFKNTYKGQYIILQVTFRLNRIPNLHTGYGAIREELQKMGAEPTIHSVAEAVERIRRSKLPDPAVIGNAGSFFKNPLISRDHYERLLKEFPSLPGYPGETAEVKVPAGWLIEQCGWKGVRRGDAGCHAQQALVLVNYGQATGQEILQLSSDIQGSVSQKFGIQLEREVNIV